MLCNNLQTVKIKNILRVTVQSLLQFQLCLLSDGELLAMKARYLNIIKIWRFHQMDGLIHNGAFVKHLHIFEYHHHKHCTISNNTTSPLMEADQPKPQARMHLFGHLTFNVIISPITLSSRDFRSP